MRADRKPSDPRAYRVAGLALAAAALVATGCGGDDATDAVQQVKDQAKEVRHDIRSGASKADIQDKIDQLQRDARDKGDDAKREAEKLRRQLRREAKEQLP
jgi:gas vesicle protein